MIKDTHLVGQQYSWGKLIEWSPIRILEISNSLLTNLVGSIFYFGYLIAEFPTVHCFSRFPIGKFLSILAMIWGLITLLMAVTRNAGGLMALRFMMGMAEAPALPGLMLVTTMWYNQREQPLRTALWSSTVASVRTIAT